MAESNERKVAPIVPRKNLNYYARAFLEKKHQNEVLWECFEFALIIAAFALLYLGQHEISEGIEIGSHVLVAIVLLLKFSSTVVAFIVPRLKDPDREEMGP